MKLCFILPGTIRIWMHQIQLADSIWDNLISELQKVFRLRPFLQSSLESDFLVLLRYSSRLYGPRSCLLASDLMNREHDKSRLDEMRGWPMSPKIGKASLPNCIPMMPTKISLILRLSR
jgi:hypothetical protein